MVQDYKNKKVNHIYIHSGDYQSFNDDCFHTIQLGTDSEELIRWLTDGANIPCQLRLCIDIDAQPGDMLKNFYSYDNCIVSSIAKRGTTNVVTINYAQQRQRNEVEYRIQAFQHLIAD